METLTRSVRHRLLLFHPRSFSSFILILLLIISFLLLVASAPLVTAHNNNYISDNNGIVSVNGNGNRYAKRSDSGGNGDNGINKNLRRKRRMYNDSEQPSGYHTLVQYMLQQSLQRQPSTSTVSAAATTRIGSKKEGSDTIFNKASNSNTTTNTTTTSSYQAKTQNLRIHFETAPIADQRTLTNDQQIIEIGADIITNILPQIKTHFSDTIRILPRDGVNVRRNFCFSTFTEYVPQDYFLQDADIFIFVGAYKRWNNIEFCNDDPNLSVLASALPCELDSDPDYDQRPIVGFINVCPNAMVGMQSSEIYDVLAHEMLHILVLNTELYKYYHNAVDKTPLTPRNASLVGPDNPSGFEKKKVDCVNNLPSRKAFATCENTIRYREEVINEQNNEYRGYYEITLPTVRQVARNQFACQKLTGARLENQPTNSADCTGSHFDERFFYSHVMSAVYNYGSSHFTPLLLALMEDSGWYAADYTNAEVSSFGLGAGCGFVRKDCIVNGGDIPQYNRGFFCNELTAKYNWRCGPNLHHRGYCDLAYNIVPDRSYFQNPYYGPTYFHYADWCPMVNVNNVQCNNASPFVNKVDLNVEVFGDSSKCMDVSIDSNPTTAICVKTACDKDKKQFQFQVGQRYYVCKVKDSGKIIEVNTMGKKYTFTCPSLRQACPDMFCPSNCSGKGICNWDADPFPVCECFDATDTTPGCYNSHVLEPVKCEDVEEFVEYFDDDDDDTTETVTEIPSNIPSYVPSEAPSDDDDDDRDGDDGDVDNGSNGNGEDGAPSMGYKTGFLSIHIIISTTMAVLLTNT